MKKIMSVALQFLGVFSFVLISSTNVFAQKGLQEVKHFEKIIVSPHVELVLKEGNNESVSIKSKGVEEDKINVKVVGKTLRIYLDKAKGYTKQQKTRYYGRKTVTPMYRGVKIVATVTYKELKKLSVRGEEDVECDDVLKADKFRLKVFGEADVRFAAVQAKYMKTTLFGENNLRIKSGSLEKQKITSFGENTVDSKKLEAVKAKTVSFGESDFRLNVSKKVKFSSYGESELSFKGDAHVAKGIVLGENEIYKYY